MDAFFRDEFPKRLVDGWVDGRRNGCREGLFPQLVVQAVIEDQGIALGWRHLTERLIDAGLLARVTDHALRTGKGFYVVWPKARELSDSMKRVRDWLIDRA